MSRYRTRQRSKTSSTVLRIRSSNEIKWVVSEDEDEEVSGAATAVVT